MNLSTALQRFEAFFLQPGSRKPLARFRIAFGTFAFAELLALRPNWQDLPGREGIVQWVISKELFAVDGVPHVYHLAERLEPSGVSADLTLHGVLYAYLFAL